MPKKTFYITKEELVELFIVKNLTREFVAKYFGCSDALIKQLCRKFNVKKPRNLSDKNLKRAIQYEIICKNCGNTFFVDKYRAITADEKNKAKFCGYDCHYAFHDLGDEHRKAVRNHNAAIRRARLLNQTPNLSSEERSKIIEIYKNRPEGCEVDHIKPLSTGGLHHPDNLQYLPIKENRKKWCHVQKY